MRGDKRERVKIVVAMRITGTGGHNIGENAKRISVRKVRLQKQIFFSFICFTIPDFAQTASNSAFKIRNTKVGQGTVAVQLVQFNVARTSRKQISRISNNA